MCILINKNELLRQTLAPASPEVYGDNGNLSGIKEENDLLGFQFIFSGETVGDL